MRIKVLGGYYRLVVMGFVLVIVKIVLLWRFLVFKWDEDEFFKVVGIVEIGVWFDDKSDIWIYIRYIYESFINLIMYFI